MGTGLGRGAHQGAGMGTGERLEAREQSFRTRVLWPEEEAELPQRSRGAPQKGATDRDKGWLKSRQRCPSGVFCSLKPTYHGALSAAGISSPLVDGLHCGHREPLLLCSPAGLGLPPDHAEERRVLLTALQR
ncbi:hypothetical protein NDU88_000334 [Pleurodeles waltl]|uniref:Uncharacterized protein n=1 Tax=Pleurodeles waltl TaxID=8319 RepID=A0AAV7SWA6_PLEWA|nr:hypothetical protein NDU88_000334 [Pleurodeles waltl]